MSILWKSFLRLIGVLVFFSVSAFSADVESTIAKARRYVGPESVLEQVRSVHFVGTLTTDDNQKVAIEIIFQKPYRQRIVTTSAEKTEITALDDYEGWQRIEDLKDRSRWRMKLLTKDQVTRLRANTWENLAFFRGLENRGGRVEALGDVVIEGRSVHKLSFIHRTGSIFTRYFDADSGKLVLTETEQGGQIREEGEILVDGLRFPQKIVTTTVGEGGRERSVTILFERVAVNENFAATDFAVPVTNPGSGR